MKESLTTTTDLTEAHDYAVRTHEYIKYLNHLTDQRANYLIVASSILIGALVNLGIKPEGDPLHSITYWMTVATIFPMVISVLIAVRVILPKTDAMSPFQTTAIAEISIDDYVKNGKCITLSKSLDILLRENHTVSKIVEFKSNLVKMAARALFVGIIIGVVSWVSTILIRVKF
jgi:hypothetical protein